MTEACHSTNKRAVQSLDAMTFPLFGERLIEASAGTGKTFTIATLYLRLLLGHGERNAYAKPLNVDQILVVTFTEAATTELRDRIRQRIHEARVAFSCSQSADPVIGRLLSDCDAETHHFHAKRLLAAERQMDEAAIFTIHGFCQRMLKQNAFESGALFETEFITDESQIKFNAIADFWRSNFYQYKDAMVEMVHDFWSSPRALLKAINPYLANEEIQFVANASETDLETEFDQMIAKIERVKLLWRDAQEEITELITSGALNGNSYRAKSVEIWLCTMADWSRTETCKNDLPSCIEKFQQSVLTSKTKKGKSAPAHPVFDAVEALLSEPLSLQDSLLLQAIRFVRQRMAHTKQQAQLLSFDDLLSGLSGALSGSQACELAERIRAQYPVAMIDEFQDTDQQQYDIFNAIYGRQADTGLFMIGDPKQAIYSFRGADIFTYMQARENVDAHYTLDKNWRSADAMVAGVNHLFGYAANPFIYEASISFQPVKSQGKAKPFTLNDQHPPALQLWLHNEEDQTNVTKSQYQQAYAKATANQIATLLTAAQNGNATLGDRPVQASDIAVLVRTGVEAQLVREQLNALNIASIYMSNRDSVFSCREAKDLYHIFAAILNPEDESLLRSALATGVFAKPAAELDQLSENEQLWEQTVAEFQRYQQTLQRRGFLPVLRQLLSQQNVAATMLAQRGGERRLTDLLHLGELLQEASLQLDGEYSLFRWFGEKLENPSGDAQEQLVRLESEADLVQVVTIHKSKGLEYNLVFIPFICSTRTTSTPLYHEQGNTYAYLKTDDALKAVLEKADRERLAEDLRLLYVAMTRGVYATWLGLAAVKMGNAKNKMHLNAMGYLLQQGEACKDEEFQACVEKMSGQHDAICVTSPPLDDVTPYQPELQTAVIPLANTVSRPVASNWWVTSYSALSRHSHTTHSQPVIGADNTGYDASLEIPGFDMEMLAEQSEEQTQTWDIFNFPRGATAGTLLHTLFEQIDFSDLNEAALIELIDQLLEREGYEPEWREVLLLLVNQVLDCPLQDGFCLRQLKSDQKLVEMEFFIPIASLNCRDLNALMKQYDPLSQQAGELDFKALEGMLKGFIDLVFTYQGKYYVLDYKSNHLGDAQTDYHCEAIETVMIDHRYELQYQLYSLALHRFLQNRIPDYDYAQHFGGVYYLFLRGMQPDTGDEYGVYYTRPDAEFIRELDQLFLCGPELCEVTA